MVFRFIKESKCRILRNTLQPSLKSSRKFRVWWKSERRFVEQRSQQPALDLTRGIYMSGNSPLSFPLLLLAFSSINQLSTTCYILVYTLYVSLHSFHFGKTNLPSCVFRVSAVFSVEEDAGQVPGKKQSKSAACQN